MALSLTACGANSGNSSSSVQQSQPSNSANSTEQSAVGTSSEATSTVESTEIPTTPETGKTLVVYYSATNNTKAVAEIIADETGADLFELVPTNPYSSDDLNWRDRNSRVCREHDDVSLRVVELENAVPDNWESYDTVFVGYPIWWGIAAWVVDGFISANDFSGKTIVPFCTSTSSGFGDSGDLLKEAAGTGNWLDGERFREHPTEDSVRDWVKGLGL